MKISSLTESSCGSTTSGSVATVAQPMSAPQKRGKGSMFKGIKTSKKYANSLHEGIYNQVMSKSKEPLDFSEKRKDKDKEADFFRRAFAADPKHDKNCPAQIGNQCNCKGNVKEGAKPASNAKNEADQRRYLDKEKQKRQERDVRRLTKSGVVSPVVKEGAIGKAVKNVKRGMQGWGTPTSVGGGSYGDDEFSPKNIVKRNKGYDNDKVKALHHSFDRTKVTPHSPQGLQKNVLDREMKKRGLAQEGAKVDRMVGHIKSSEKKLGKSNKEAENIAWATANKRGMLNNKNKKVAEDIDQDKDQVWYVRADGNILRTDDGQPKKFFGKKNANTGGIAHQRQHPGVKVTLTTNPEDKDMKAGSIMSGLKMAESQYDLDDYYNAKGSLEYGKHPFQSNNRSGSYNSLTKRDPMDRKSGVSSSLPADAFGRTTGKIPKGIRGKVHRGISAGEMTEAEIHENDVVLAPGKGRRLKSELLDKPQVSVNPTDVVKVDVPLLIRLLEYAKEDAVDDMALHDLAEKLVAGCSRGRTLSMKDYDRLVPEGKSAAMHNSPSGKQTNMDPDDDDYQMNYGPDGLAAQFDQEMNEGPMGREIGAVVGGVAGGALGARGGPQTLAAGRTIGATLGAELGDHLGDKVSDWIGTKMKKKPTPNAEVDNLIGGPEDVDEDQTKDKIQDWRARRGAVQKQLADPHLPKDPLTRKTFFKKMAALNKEGEQYGITSEDFQPKMVSGPGARA